LKWEAQQKGPVGGDLLGQGGDSDDETAKLFESMSFKNLYKSIEAKHPTDPETREKYNFKERITVKDLERKLTDVFGCIFVKTKCKKGCKIFRKKFLPEQPKKEIPKPPNSMGQMPMDGSSSSESEGVDDGEDLTECS
jgi:hypothetical protein